MTKLDLITKRAKAWENCKAFLDSHRNESGVLSAEDDAAYTKMNDEIDSLTHEIERLEAAEARDAAFAQVNDRVGAGQPGKNADLKTGRASDAYKAAFAKVLRHRNVRDAALQEDTDSEGGYLVPTEFERTLINTRDKVDPIFALAGRITLAARDKVMPYVAGHSEATLIAEEGAYQESEPTFGQTAFHAYKFGLISKASEELIADSAFSIEAFLAEDMGRAIGIAEAGYFYTGTGSAQPQGILAGAQTGVTLTSESVITADNIIDLYYSLAEQYRANASFIFNDATVKVIRKLKTGDGQYLWTPGLAGQPDTILGKPLHTSNNMPTITGDAKVGLFGDISLGFKIADRQGVAIRRLDELYAANGQVGFKGHARSDSRVTLAEALKTLVMG